MYSIVLLQTFKKIEKNNVNASNNAILYFNFIEILIRVCHKKRRYAQNIQKKLYRSSFLEQKLKKSNGMRKLREINDRKFELEKLWTYLIT